MEEQLNIKKQSEELDKQEKHFGKYKEELKAKCTHTRNGELTLVPKKDGNKDGELVYVCKQCRKVLRFSRIDENDLQKSIDLIDQAIDIIKASANTNNENDDEMVKRMAKVQYRLRNDIMPYYKAATSRNNRGNKNRDNNNDGGAWGKANII
jgi:hypothetical protein